LFVSDSKTKLSQNDLQEFLKRYNELDNFFSDKKLGCFRESNKTYFRLFAPSAKSVILCIYDNVDQKNPTEHLLQKDDDGVWEISILQELYGKFYGYKVYHKGEENLNGHAPICIDPYSKAVATHTSYMNPRLSLITKEEEFDWEETSPLNYKWEDLIIYEMHLRDMTAHKSSGSQHPGSYKGMLEKGIKGGLEYIKSLGVNAVEILPIHDFGYCEVPYKKIFNGLFNTWNPYERNHWGYMTSSFFAPASYYCESWKKFRWNKWMGIEGRQINDFKNVVKAFHKEGIAVIMDVVFNHLSEYETGNLKQIDKEYYFRLDENSNYISESGCGNDLKTERPMMRRIIIDSILHWMKEYHIDGFRFDLGKLIDWQTIEEVIKVAKQVNPNVVFICEPWGGGYDPNGFSQRGWASWNDQIRNGIKGENPFNGRGWIFGQWYGNNSPERIKSYVNGTLMKDHYGLFINKEHSVNYLESHDGYTLGDFIRLASGELNPRSVIKDVNKFVKLSSKQLKINKLAALFLFTSRGIVMIHSGQEFARTKVIPYNSKMNDPHKGNIDHNSYNKDDKTNYLNYKHADINKELLDFYKCLINIRKKYKAFTRTEYNNTIFFNHPDNPLCFSFLMKHEGESFVVLLNADQFAELELPLPNGKWEVIIDSENACNEPYITQSKIKLEPISGIILKNID